MRDMGAEISDDGVIKTFGNDDEAIEAAENGVAVMHFFVLPPFIFSNCNKNDLMIELKLIAILSIFLYTCR